MNEEILLELESTVTYDIYKEYYLFSLFRGKFFKRKIRLLYLILFIGVSVSLYNVTTFGFDFISTLLLALLIVVGVFMSYIIIFGAKNYYKTSKKVLANPTVYKFTPEYIDVESKTESVSGKSVIMYDSLHKVCETNNYLYLYISNAQAYLIPKNKIPMSMLEQLRTIFIDKLGKNYYNYCS